MVEAVVFATVIADLGILGPAAPTLIGALAFVAVLLIVTGLRRTIAGGSTGIAARLERFGALAPNTPAGAAAARGGRGRPAIYGAIDKAAARRGWGVKIADDLARADVKITVGEFVVARIVFASVGGLLGFALPIGGRYLLMVLLAALGYWLPRFYVDRQKTQRLRAFNGQLAETIGLLSSALRSGYSLLQAMELVSREGAVPVSSEFERVVREVGLGLSPEQALGNLVRRMESDDLGLLVTVINVQREVGGNLAEVLDSIQNTIRERVKLMGDIRVLTAQQQYSGYIVGLLPVVLALVLFVINPKYMLATFQKTIWCGWTMFGCAAVMILVGFFIIQRIVDIKV